MMGIKEKDENVTKIQYIEACCINKTFLHFPVPVHSNLSLSEIKAR